MADYTWQIGTDRPDGPITANAEQSDQTPVYTRGGQQRLTFGFWHDAGIDANQGDHIARYEALREYGDFAGSMTVTRAWDGTPHYAEHLPASASVDSLVLDFVPGADVTSTPGFWAIVKGVEDPTRYPASAARLGLTVVVLAELGEYASRADVEAALGSTIL